MISIQNKIGLFHWVVMGVMVYSLLTILNENNNKIKGKIPDIVSEPQVPDTTYTYLLD